MDQDWYTESIRRLDGRPAAVFFGRWQPFHVGHETLIRKKLDQKIPCLVLVRNMPPDDGNPYTPQEAAAMVRAAFEGEDVTVVVMPDIESVNWGRGVGYEVNEHVLPADVQRISATEIRKRIANSDDSWKEFVNARVARWLEAYYERDEDEVTG